jgi:hypothetical protein
MVAIVKASEEQPKKEVVVTKPPKDVARAWTEDTNRIKAAMDAVKATGAKVAYDCGTVLREVYKRGTWMYVTATDGTTPRYPTFKDVIEEFTPFKRSYGYMLMDATERLSLAEFKAIGVTKAVLVGTSLVSARGDDETPLHPEKRASALKAAEKQTEQDLRATLRALEGREPPKAGARGLRASPTAGLVGQEFVVPLKGDHGLQTGQVDLTDTTVLRVTVLIVGQVLTAKVQILDVQAEKNDNEKEPS